MSIWRAIWHFLLVLWPSTTFATPSGQEKLSRLSTLQIVLQPTTSLFPSDLSLSSSFFAGMTERKWGPLAHAKQSPVSECKGKSGFCQGGIRKKNFSRLAPNSGQNCGGYYSCRVLLEDIDWMVASPRKLWIFSRYCFIKHYFESKSDVQQTKMIGYLNPGAGIKLSQRLSHVSQKMIVNYGHQSS